MSNKLDRSENHLINICGIEDYEMKAPENEFRLVSDEESGETEMSYDEGNPDESLSSENSYAESSSKDCWNLVGYLIILVKKRFQLSVFFLPALFLARR